MNEQIKNTIIYKDISRSKEEVFDILNPGTYIFYFKNKQGNLKFEISTQNAKVYIFGEYEANLEQNFSLNTYQIHSQKNSESYLVLKGVFYKNSSLNYTGTIEIKKNATNSIATLENKNIILEDNALVTTSPILKIKPHDVICKHGATISKLNEHQIYFLESRGINKEDAKNILIEGFLSEIKEKINKLKK